MNVNHPNYNVQLKQEKINSILQSSSLQFLHPVSLAGLESLPEFNIEKGQYEYERLLILLRLTLYFVDFVKSDCSEL